jgi:hypothetical protein
MVIIVSTLGLVSSGSARDARLLVQADANTATIVGSWHFMGIGAPGTPPEDPLLATFSSDGVVTVSSRAVRPALPGMPFAYVHFSTGHGAWEQGEDGTVSFSVVHLRSDEAGVFRGTVTFSGSITVDADGQSVAGEASYTVRDPAGAVQSTIPTSLDGQRIMVEPVGIATPQG